MTLFGGRRLAPPETPPPGGQPLNGSPLVMGILNLTEDSFYAQSRAADADSALRRAVAMAGEGADMIDAGAESTRPGASPAPEERELSSLIPAIAAIRRELPGVPISADTRRASVAEAAIGAGADVINDVSGLTLPGEAERMAGVVARTGAAYVLTHTKGTPDVMCRSPRYDDLFGEIFAFFEEKLKFLESRGAKRERVILDPGIGFGKRAPDNLAIIANVGKFSAFGLPILIGASRKGFIGKACGGESGPDSRLEGTLAISSYCAMNGVDIVRVHDAGANKRAIAMTREIMKCVEM
jgi:dihydropteroate synthase